jgi:NADH-quinone oxidoreductase subunit J
VLLFAAFRVITARNPVYAGALPGAGVLPGIGHLALLRAEFLAISLVLVYVGAVMVLFLFVVMMLDIDIDSLREVLEALPAGRVRRRHDRARNGRRADGRLSA